MKSLDQSLIDDLFEQAKVNPRLRQNYDLRTSEHDNSQRMLNALLPGTVVPVHKHPMSNENVILLCGKLVEVIYEEKVCDELNDSPAKGELVEVSRHLMDPSAGIFGCVIPAGAWHTVEVLEPSVIYEAKDGRYKEDGSVYWEDL